MRRNRNAKIVATLAPASSRREVVEALFAAGADVFGLNFSHGAHEDHASRLEIIRAVERDAGRPIGVLLDLQGPKLRIGTFRSGPVRFEPGAMLRLDLDPEPSDASRVSLPHREVFAALAAGTQLLRDDGRIRLRVERCSATSAHTRVVTGGARGFTSRMRPWKSCSTARCCPRVGSPNSPSPGISTSRVSAISPRRSRRSRTGRCPPAPPWRSPRRFPRCAGWRRRRGATGRLPPEWR
jgi:hypothetical protein